MRKCLLLLSVLALFAACTDTDFQEIEGAQSEVLRLDGGDGENEPCKGHCSPGD